MKKFISFLLIFVTLFIIAGCGGKTPEQPEEPQDPIVEKYTVQFYVEDELFKTLKIEDGKTIGSDKVDKPMLEGFEFKAWKDSDGNVIDLDSYAVKGALKLYAYFEEVVTDDTLVVNAKKEEGVDYYLVVGWWETTAVNDDGTPKITSSLTVDTVRVFYSNLVKYLKKYGANEEQLKLVQFRDYSSATVAEMGAAINADADVDLVIGVGNNINSTAGVSLFEGNDGKTTAKMGSQGLSRYVALPEHEVMNSLAISIFDWIKTEVGQTAFTSQLDDAQITVVPERTNNIDVTVTIYGDNGETKESKLATKADPIALPTITVAEGHKFLGYATAADATVAEIVIAHGVALTYAEIEELLKGANSIALYPVIIEEVVNTEFDLVVYIHVTSTSKISEAEASLVKMRFEESLSEAKNIEYVWVTEGKAADFYDRINADIAEGKTIDVVIGGNATTKLLSAIDETYINVSCGAGHFADGSRKIIVLSTAATAHLDLAKAFYDFMVAEAPELKLHIAYWARPNWITAEEITNVTAGIKGYINTLFAQEDAFTTYKLAVEFYNTTKEKVADLSAETKAFNDGKGVGLIIGTGGNAVNEGNMGTDIIEQKDCPTSLVAAGRKVSICKDSYIYRALYDNYFTVSE